MPKLSVDTADVALREMFAGWDSVKVLYDESLGAYGCFVLTAVASASSLWNVLNPREHLAPRPVRLPPKPRGVRFHGRIVGAR